MKRLLPLGCIVLASLAAWLLGLHEYLNFETVREHQQELATFIDEHFLQAILLYSGVFILVVWFALPVATFMTFAGGFFLGQWIGTVVTVICLTVGASLLFISTKIASKNLLDEERKPWIQKLKVGFQENAFIYMLTLRLMPLFPFFAVNIAAGVLQIPFRLFFFGTLIGIIPVTYIYVMMGMTLHSLIQEPDIATHIIFDSKIMIGFTGLGILSLLPLVWKKWKAS